jgi:beta-N-acetylhexosaminidase
MLKKVFTSQLFYWPGKDTMRVCQAGWPGRWRLPVYIVFFSIFCQFHSIAQSTKEKWVDSVFQTLSVNEKIGQLFMIPVSSMGSPEEKKQLLDKVKKYKPGSVLITHGGPLGHALLLNKLQAESKVPLLAAIHAEWGLGQSLDSTMSFAKPMQMGAIHHDSLLFEIGKEIAQQMKTLGIHLNFALNADIHVGEDLYPAMLRYFGDDKREVAFKSIQLMKGLQQGGVLTVAKHVANPKKDRHIAIKDSSLVIDLNQIDTIGFYPYQKLMENGVDGILTSHLDYVLPEKKKNIPAPISAIFLTDMIKKKLGFNGLAIAEMPYLRMITNKRRDGDTERLAFEIGNDVLVDPKNIGVSIKNISRAIKKDDRLKAQLDVSVKKILMAKYDAGLLSNGFINTDNLQLKLHSPSARVLQLRLAEASPTLLKNSASLVPIASVENHSFASISFGKSEVNEFNRYLSKYASFEKHAVQALKDTIGLQEKVKDFTHIVISLFPPAKGLTLQIASLIQKLSISHQVVVCSFGDPEDLKFIDHSTLIAAYSDDGLVQRACAQLIFGALAPKGKLPITVSEKLKLNQGELADTLDILRFSLPENTGMDSRTLEKIKLVMQESIDAGATPGCQVLIVKDGKVVFENSAGWHTYDKKDPVTDETIYDLASVTKVTATLQTVMFMHEKRLIDVNKKMAVYLPELRESNKKDFTIRDILTHQAGLWPFLPFWSETVKDSVSLYGYYSNKQSDDYPFPVADSLFAIKTMKDSLWQWIIKAKVREKPARTVYDYRYSDMGFYMLQRLAEKLLNQPMDEFLDQNFYQPMGAYTVGYLPRQKFPSSQIAPTEDDRTFRKRLLLGYVHDQGAAMHGGIAGHAGLFGRAIDLAKMGQMWLKGTYGGNTYFKPSTIDFFAARQYQDSRRGLGWDKPALSDPSGPTSIHASAKTFGHTGFTGTCIWVDPMFNLIYVFLSNRVYPDMNNNKILNGNIRPRIHDLIYQSIFNYCKTKG